MRLRRAVVVPLLFVFGCQDRKADGPAVVDVTGGPAIAVSATAPAPATTAAPEVDRPGPRPLTGSIAGQPFRPQDVSMEGMKDGSLLMFRQTLEGGEASIQFLLPVPSGDQLAGRDWKFGGNLGDPVLIVTRSKAEPANVFGPDYTMTLRVTRQTREKVEGDIDLTVKNPADTALTGSFRAAYRKSPTDPLEPADAPYVHGTITIQNPKKTEKLAAGYVGVGADGKPYANEVGFPVDVGQTGYAPIPSPQRPSQVSWLSSTPDAIRYRHLNVPPGDYLVYVRRDTILSAWQRIQLKAGDQRTNDFTIDPAATGEVVVTLPATKAKDPAESSLALVPLKADLPELGLGSETYFNVATVKPGETTITVPGIPAGKYRAVRGTDVAEVEVVAGKAVSVTLAPAKD